MNRIVPGGVIAGIALFAWGYVSYMFLPIADMGIRKLPSEQMVMSAVERAVQEPGFYAFPYANPKIATKPELDQWRKRYAAGPTGVLVYRPGGPDPRSLARLAIQLGVCIGAATVAALLLSQTSGLTVVGRVLFVGALGLFAWAAVHGPQWNAHGFPSDFTIAAAADMIGGWLVAGLVLAGLVRGQPRMR